jgi:hypothetical protein
MSKEILQRNSLELVVTASLNMSTENLVLFLFLSSFIVVLKNWFPSVFSWFLDFIGYMKTI